MIAASAQVELKLPTQQGIPAGGEVRFYRSAPGLAAPIETLLNDVEFPAWPASLLYGKIGYGRNAYGEGGYGRGYGGFAYGRGLYGRGPYGCGAKWLKFQSPDLDDGSYVFAAHPVDPAGNEDTSPVYTAACTVAGTPEAPTDATAADDAGDVLLGWTLSEDDVS